MTNEIENLDAKLLPLYKAQENRFKVINEELTHFASALTNLPLPIKAEIQLEGIRFLIFSEGKLYSEVNIYNKYVWDFREIKIKFMEFNPELCASGTRIGYNEGKNAEDLTKLKLTTALAIELENYCIENVGSKFITRLVECFAEIRVSQNVIDVFKREPRLLN